MGTGLAGALGLLVAADGGNHAGTFEAGDLHCIPADRSGPAGDQNRLAVNRAIGHHAAVGGHRRNAHAGPGLEGSVLGQAHRLVLGHDRVLRGCPPEAAERGLVNPDPLADARTRHARADRVDDAGAILMRDHEGKRHHGIAAVPATLLGVRRIDGRTMDPHPHFARGRLGCRAFAHGQHFACGSLALIPGGFHGVFLKVVVIGRECAPGRWQ